MDDTLTARADGSYGVWMATMGRTSLIRLELMVICLIGMLPALAVVAAFGKARTPVDMSSPR